MTMLYPCQKTRFAHTFTRGYTYVQAYAYVCKRFSPE